MDQDVGTTFLQQLKQESRVYHELLDKKLNILRQDLTYEAYLHILQRFWGFYHPIETQIGSILSLREAAFDFGKRRKCALLERDLQALGTDGLLPICDDLPTLQDIEQVIGSLYVMEGATLGGQIIARHIKNLFALGPQNGCAFFLSYGRDVGSMWQAFGVLVAAYVAAHGKEEIIIFSACETFEKLHRWLSEDHSLWIKEHRQK